MLLKRTRESVWSKTQYPDSMSQLPERVRRRAIEIGNSLMFQDLDKTIRETMAISLAKEWAQSVGLNTRLKAKRSGLFHKRHRKLYH